MHGVPDATAPWLRSGRAVERTELDGLVRALIEAARQRARLRRRRRAAAVGIALGIAAAAYLAVNEVTGRVAHASAGVAPFAVKGPAGRRSQIVFATAGATGGTIYRIFADGSGLESLAKTRAYAWAPVLSPDGRKIEFTAEGRGGRSIIVMNDDGSGRRQLVVNGEFASWSPHGRRVAFDRQMTTGGGIYVVSAAGGARPRRLTAVGAFPDWSPDGSRIAYLGPTGIHVMNADGSHNRLLFRSTIALPAWSPDGSKIAFQKGGRVYVVNADGTGLRQLRPHIDGKMSDCRIAWSPDGQRLILNPYRLGRLYVMNLDGSHLAPLTGLPAHFGGCGVSWRHIAGAK
jgi:Tol biopolymer transport system component